MASDEVQKALQHPVVKITSTVRLPLGNRCIELEYKFASMVDGGGDLNI